MSQSARRRQVTDRPPPPGLGPSHSHARPVPLGLLPPRGQQPPAEKGKPITSCFRRATRKRRPSYRRGRTLRAALSPLLGFAKHRTHDVRCSRLLSRDLESGGSRSPWRSVLLPQRFLALAGSFSPALTGIHSTSICELPTAC